MADPLPARPYVLDNFERDHARALTYLIGDLPLRHALAVATGFVDLGGLHHLATIADGRPTRLLIGAQPAPALGAELPIGLFEQYRERLRDERDLSRFPPRARRVSSKRWRSGSTAPRFRCAATSSSSCTARHTSSATRPMRARRS